VCDGLASTFATMPGLISKVWLADPATNTYGGVYTWRDRRSYEDFTKGISSRPLASTQTSPTSVPGISQFSRAYPYQPRTCCGSRLTVRLNVR